MGPLLRCQPDGAGPLDGNGPQAYCVIEQPYGCTSDSLLDGPLRLRSCWVWRVGSRRGRGPERPALGCPRWMSVSHVHGYEMLMQMIAADLPDSRSTALSSRSGSGTDRPLPSAQLGSNSETRPQTRGATPVSQFRNCDHAWLPRHANQQIAENSEAFGDLGLRSGK